MSGSLQLSLSVSGSLFTVSLDWSSYAVPTGHCQPQVVSTGHCQSLGVSVLVSVSLDWSLSVCSYSSLDLLVSTRLCQFMVVLTGYCQSLTVFTASLLQSLPVTVSIWQSLIVTVWSPLASEIYVEHDLWSVESKLPSEDAFLALSDQNFDLQHSYSNQLATFFAFSMNLLFISL